MTFPHLTVFRRRPVRALGPLLLLFAASVPGAVLWLRGRDPVEVVLVAGASTIFLALAWIDLRRMVIPNRLVYPALALALAVSGAWPDRCPLNALGGGLGALAVGSIARWLSHSGLGGGDVKLAALVGVAVGYPGLLLASVLTAITGGVAAAMLLATRRAEWSARLPYGPFLSLGAIVALLR